MSIALDFGTWDRSTETVCRDRNHLSPCLVCCDLELVSFSIPSTGVKHTGVSFFVFSREVAFRDIGRSTRLDIKISSPYRVCCAFKGLVSFPIPSTGGKYTDIPFWGFREDGHGWTY